MRIVGLLFLLCTSIACASQAPLLSAWSYGEKLRAAVKSHIVISSPIAENPTAEVEMRMASDGSIQSWRLVKSSGVPHWDYAVVKAVEKTGKLQLNVEAMPLS